MERGTATRQAADAAAPQRSAMGGQRPPPAVNPWFQLHQTVGNQAMSRLLRAGAVQAKLHVSQPGDADESEADHAAEQVVRARGRTGVIQRKCACGGTCSTCAAEEDERRMPRVQLSTLSTRLQRAAKSEPAVADPESPGPVPGLIVDDDVPVNRRGQMHRSAFFDLLEADICTTADAILAASGRSTASCPYIAKWMAFYREQSAAHIEQAILKYAPEATEASTVLDYIRAVRHRVRRAVVAWVKTGRVVGVPPGVGLTPDAAGDRGEEGRRFRRRVDARRLDGRTSTTQGARGS